MRAIGRRHRVQHLDELAASDEIELGHDVPAGLGELDDDDTPIASVADPLHESALLHPVDDRGRIRQRNVAKIGETAHRQRPEGGKAHEDMELARADRLLAQPLEGFGPMTADEQEQLVGDRL